MPLGSITISKQLGKGFFTIFCHSSTWDEPRQHLGHVRVLPLSLGLHGRHRVNKEPSEVFLQHLFATRVP